MHNVPSVPSYAQVFVFLHYTVGKMVFLQSLRLVVINYIVLFFLVLSRTLKLVHRKQSSFQKGNLLTLCFPVMC